jgi:hypothetical protein
MSLMLGLALAFGTVAAVSAQKEGRKEEGRDVQVGNLGPGALFLS